MQPDRLTVAFVTPEYPPDPYSSGLATYTRTLAEALAARGHQVHVVSRGRSDTPETSVRGGVFVHRVWPARPVLPPLFTLAATATLALRGAANEWLYRRHVARTLDRLVREHGVQVVESVDMAAEAMLYDPARHPAVPFVVRLHTPTAVGEYYDRNLPEIARRFVRSIERRHLLHATHLVGISDRATQVILEHMRIERDDVVSIPNPPSFDPDRIPPAPGDDGETVLFVGRVNRWKGVHLLMRTVAPVLRQRPNTRFVLAGEAAYMATRGADMLTHMLGLVPPEHRHAVTFLGRVPHEELGRLYRTAAVSVLPSLFDAFPYACMEAMAFGKAIVASDHGGMAELLDGGACGLLFSPPDVDRLASHLLTLLENEPMRRDLGARARERVRSTYGPDVILDRFEAFYRGALADRARLPSAPPALGRTGS
jgi:glycogen synthase